MPRLGQPINQLFPRSERVPKGDRILSNASTKMSEHSEKPKNDAKVPKLSDSMISEPGIGVLDESDEAQNHLVDECNDLDFRKFVADLTTPETIDSIVIDGESNMTSAKNRICYERTAQMERIIIDNIPGEKSENKHVMKLKITLPTSRFDRQLTNSTSTLMRASQSPTRGNINHLPIMGQTALMNKRVHQNRDSEIVRELVTTRFQDSLLDHYERSFHRQSSRLYRDFSLLSSTTDDITSNPPEIGDNATYSLPAQTGINKTEDILQETTSNSSGGFKTSATSSSSGIGSRGSSKKDKSNKTFLLSTDDHNAMTPNETYSISSVLPQSSHSNAAESDENKTNDIEYDESQFLRDALGGHDCCSPDVSIAANSIGTSGISDLVSNNGTFDKCDKCDDLTIFESGSKLSEYDYYTYNPRAEFLLQSQVQNQIIMQTSKALNFCKTTKEFNAGVEEMEAERILLIATCKRDAIQGEIHRLDSMQTIHAESNNLGCIRISQIVLPPKQRNPLFAKMFDKKKKKEVSELYICVLKHRANVFGTQAVRPDADGFVRFQEEIVFDRLDTDFEINIMFFIMKVRNNTRLISHESKYHLERETSMCPVSPVKLFQNSRQYKSLMDPPQTEIHQQPAYILCGHTKLKINNIGHLGHFRLSSLTLPSLEGNLIIDFVTGVRIKEDYSGFLNIAIETGESLIWNRRWCALSGPSLNYYNYPGEENPLGFVDLHYCASATIASADREICARPRTLLIEVFSNIDDTFKRNNVTRYFLGADSKQYLDMWEQKLNNTLGALRIWGVLKGNSTFKRN